RDSLRSGREASTERPRPDPLVAVVELGYTKADRVEQVDEVVPADLLLLHQHAGDPVESLAVRRREVVRDDVRLPDDLRGGAPLGWVGERAGDGGGRHPAARAAHSVHDLQADALHPVEGASPGLVLGLTL